MFLILVVLSVFAALAFHLAFKRFWIASVASALMATLVFWMLSASHFGWFDRVFYENITSSLLVALITSIVVGGMLKKIRK